VEEVLHVEVVVEEQPAAVFYARRGGQVGVSPLAKLRNEIDRHVAVVEGHDSTHWAATAALCPPQNMHASNWIRGNLLTARHMWLEGNVESVDMHQ